MAGPYTKPRCTSHNRPYALAFGPVVPINNTSTKIPVLQVLVRRAVPVKRPINFVDMVNMSTLGQVLSLFLLADPAGHEFAIFQRRNVGSRLACRLFKAILVAALFGPAVFVPVPVLAGADGGHMWPKSGHTIVCAGPFEK